jgi:hypothetical protein
MLDSNAQVIETFDRFNECVTKIENSSLARRLNSAIPHVFIKFSENFEVKNLGKGKLILSGNIESWTNDYSDEEVDAFILTYRLFDQKRDSISIGQIRDIYSMNGMTEEAQIRFEHVYSEIENFWNSPTTIGVSGKYILVKQLMDVIIYGGLAHRNPDKEKIFKSWMQQGSIGLFQVELLSSLSQMLEFLRSCSELWFC